MQSMTRGTSVPSIQTISIGIALVTTSLLTRMLPALYRLVPFGFDHGKDSLAILGMIVGHTPKLIGPWTSIPGVFFGPGWYYLLLPGYILTNGDPISAVYTLIILSVIQALLVWKIWGITPALLIILAPLYIITSTSAWNPYPMTLLTSMLLAITWITAKKQELSLVHALILGLTAGLGFHFSAAYAIFYIPFVLAAPIIFRTKKPFLSVLIILGGVISAFIPQLLFELRHSFVQSIALLRYFSAGEPHALSLTKVAQVLHVISKELSLAVFPRMNGGSTILNYFNLGIMIVLSVAFCYLFFQWWKKRDTWQRQWCIWSVLFLIIIPTIGYFFLHFNVWYVYGMAPVLTVLTGLIVARTSRPIFVAILTLFVVITSWNLYHYVTIEIPVHNNSKTMLKTKESVLNYIVHSAQGRSFAVFTYVPDIYDYSYKYLWYRQAYNGDVFPTTVSYMPNAPEYSTDESILSSLTANTGNMPELTFYVIEQPSDSELYQQWWSAQIYGEVLSEEIIGSDVLVRTTTTGSNE